MSLTVAAATPSLALTKRVDRQMGQSDREQNAVAASDKPRRIHKEESYARTGTPSFQSFVTAAPENSVSNSEVLSNNLWKRRT